ncbi:MAG: hypothetical protein R3268_00035 [Acidiferrobacterales bacterium]|nr:hypothetical protein [Acidiferrobacterales bacterium]
MTKSKQLMMSDLLALFEQADHGQRPPLVLTKGQIRGLKAFGWQFDEEKGTCTGGRYVEVPRMNWTSAANATTLFNDGDAGDSE